MGMRIFKFISSLIALLLLPLIAVAQDAPGVSHIILLDFDGDEAVLAEAFEKRQALYKEINPDVSMRLLYDELHGSAIDRYRIIVNYPSLVDFAAAQAKERNNAEWQASRPDRTSTRTYEGLSRIVVPPLGAPKAGGTGKGPGLVQIVLFDYDGDAAELAAYFVKSQAIYAKINPEASMRLLYDEVHGSAVGRYRLHIYYPNPAYWAAAQGRERSSEELKALRKTRSGNSTRVYEGLSRIVVTAGG
jgi:hypothetical protein